MGGENDVNPLIAPLPRMRTRTFPHYGYYQHLLEIHRNTLQGVGGHKSKGESSFEIRIKFRTGFYYFQAECI